MYSSNGGEVGENHEDEGRAVKMKVKACMDEDEMIVKACMDDEKDCLNEDDKAVAVYKKTF